MIQFIPAAAVIALDANVEHRTEGDVIFQLVPTSATAISIVPDGLPGQCYTFKIVTLGTSSFVITFGTGFLTTSTLATGTTTGKVFLISFVSDGTTLLEKSRTAAM
jgi:hypothetical protein